jgi:hypothetical protein
MHSLKHLLTKIKYFPNVNQYTLKYENSFTLSQIFNEKFMKII